MKKLINQYKGSIDPEKKEQLLGRARSLMQEVFMMIMLVMLRTMEMFMFNNFAVIIIMQAGFKIGMSITH